MPFHSFQAVLRYHLWWAAFDGGYKLGPGRSLYTLQHLFELGIRWQESSKVRVAEARRWLLRAPNKTLVDAMKLLATRDYYSSEILQELARTPAMRRRLKEVGLIPSNREDMDRFTGSRSQPALSRGALKRLGVEASKSMRPRTSRSHSGAAFRQRHRGLDVTVVIGRRHPDSGEIRLSRVDLYERVWSEPISALAEKWGLSGRGLAKACQRLNIPEQYAAYLRENRAEPERREAELRGTSTAQTTTEVTRKIA